jgi:hypothetical protein
MAYCTHLTVDYHGSVKNDEIYYYSREGCNAGERINLKMMKKSARRPPQSKLKTKGLSSLTQKVHP